MRAQTESLMVVKFHSAVHNRTVWREYRISKGRNLDLVMSRFRALDSFRFAKIFTYVNKTRGQIFFYFDKHKYETY